MKLNENSKFNGAYTFIYIFFHERVIIRMQITHLQNVFRLVLPIELPSAGRDQTWNIIEGGIRATALINPRLNGVSIKVSGLTFYRWPRSGKPKPWRGGGEDRGGTILGGNLRRNEKASISGIDRRLARCPHGFREIIALRSTNSRTLLFPLSFFLPSQVFLRSKVNIVMK